MAHIIVKLGTQARPPWLFSCQAGSFSSIPQRLETIC